MNLCIKLSFGLIKVETCDPSLTIMSPIKEILEIGLGPGAKASITEVIKALDVVSINIPNGNRIQGVRTNCLVSDDWYPSLCIRINASCKAMSLESKDQIFKVGHSLAHLSSPEGWGVENLEPDSSVEVRGKSSCDVGGQFTRNQGIVHNHNSINCGDSSVSSKDITIVEICLDDSLLIRNLQDNFGHIFTCEAAQRLAGWRNVAHVSCKVCRSNSNEESEKTDFVHTWEWCFELYKSWFFSTIYNVLIA